MINRRKFLGLAGILLASAKVPSFASGEEKKKPRWMHCLVEEKERKKFDNPYDDTVYYINLFGIKSNNVENDSHGKTHDINAWLTDYYSTRNRLGVTTGGDVVFEKFSGVYLLNGDFCLLRDPNITMKQVRELVPIKRATANSYQLYLVHQGAAFDDRPLYILDELTAYINGANQIGKSGGDRFGTVLDFIPFSASLGMAVQANDSKYWKSKDGEDLKDFLGYATRKAFYAEVSQTGDQPPYENTRRRLGLLMNKDQMDFLQHELGW